MHNKINWDDYQYFLKIALLGSLKGAAEALGVNHSTVFRRINSLENKMDVRLFERLKNGCTTEVSSQHLDIDPSRFTTYSSNKSIYEIHV